MASLYFRTVHVVGIGNAERGEEEGSKKKRRVAKTSSQKLYRIWLSTFPAKNIFKCDISALPASFSSGLGRSSLRAR